MTKKPLRGVDEILQETFKVARSATAIIAVLSVEVVGIAELVKLLITLLRR